MHNLIIMQNIGSAIKSWNHNLNRTTGRSCAGDGSAEPASRRPLSGHEPTLPVLLLCADGQLLVQRHLRRPGAVAATLLCGHRLL